MQFEEGYDLLKLAREKETEDKLFLRWAFGYQFTMSFDNFKKSLEVNKDDRTAEEILDTVKEILG